MENDQQSEEARLQKAKEREELRKRMREDINEQRKKKSPTKGELEIQWAGCAGLIKKESAVPSANQKPETDPAQQAS